MLPHRLPAAAQLLAHNDHRDVPVPTRPWLGRQSWQDMLLAHWPVPAAALRALVPAELEIDTSHGSAWVSVVAYRMAHVRLRGMPDFAALNFPQLNLRTYVRLGGRAGIYFFSLDANSALAILAGRRITGLPYHAADMSLQNEQDTFNFSSARRTDGRGFVASYTPQGEPQRPKGLPQWLVERYVFYAANADGQLYAGEVCHPAWRLQPVAANVARNTLGEHLALAMGAAEFMQFAPGVDVLFWRPQRV